MNKAVVFAAGIAVALSLGAGVAAAQGVNADSLYKKHCKSCHGATGTPTERMVGMYPDLKGLNATTLKGLSADSIGGIITKGKGKDMKPFSGKGPGDFPGPWFFPLGPAALRGGPAAGTCRRTAARPSRDRAASSGTGPAPRSPDASGPVDRRPASGSVRETGSDFP